MGGYTGKVVEQDKGCAYWVKFKDFTQLAYLPRAQLKSEIPFEGGGGGVGYYLVWALLRSRRDVLSAN